MSGYVVYVYRYYEKRMKEMAPKEKIIFVLSNPNNTKAIAIQLRPFTVNPEKKFL